MLESYFEEVKQKRRKKFLFWIFVFIFATGLYFFFKGKYISININWNVLSPKEIFSPKNTEVNPQDIMHSQLSKEEPQNLITFNSFGIVNIKAFPQDTEITLNNLPYINDSKPRIDYGEYTLNFKKDEYLSGSIQFSIDDEKNFFIEDIVLLKKPEYREFSKIKDGRIIKIGENSWIGYSPSGMLLYQDSFLTGSLIHKATLQSIGDGKFLSGNTLMEYRPLEGKWISETKPEIRKFLKNCKEPLYKNKLLHCAEEKMVITNNGKIFTGVIASGDNFLRFENSIIVGDISEGNTKTFSLTGKTLSGITLENHIVNIHGNWYGFSQDVSLVPLADDDENIPFLLPLETIDFTQEIHGKYFFIGNSKKDHGKILIVADFSKNNEEIRIIQLPDIAFDEVKIYEKNRNYFIKTRNALLFFYRESNIVEWLIDGKILVIGESFALYEKDKKIWIADWMDKSLKK